MFEHKGVKIEFNENTGKFFAEVKGETVETTSLAGMKKKIENVSKFVEFSALRCDRWKKKITRIKIVGIAKPRGAASWRNKPKWRDENGNEHEHGVYVDSPENEVALTESLEMYARHKSESDALTEKHNAEESALWEKVARLPEPEIK